MEIQTIKPEVCEPSLVLRVREESLFLLSIFPLHSFLSKEPRDLRVCGRGQAPYSGSPGTQGLYDQTPHLTGSARVISTLWPPNDKLLPLFLFISPTSNPKLKTKY